MEMSSDISSIMAAIGVKAKEAATQIAVASAGAKNKALRLIGENLGTSLGHILSENTKDMVAGEEKGLNSAMLDRLALDETRLNGMIKGLNDIAALNDPVGVVTSEWERPNGLQIQRKRVPLGVIGVIFESRPNVTADAGALCIKAGNAAILRCGSESYLSSSAIFNCMRNGLVAAGLPSHAIQLVPSRGREAVGEMLKMIDHIDVIIPRGGKSLVERVTKNSKVPLFKHLEGICHTYIEENANLDMAADIVMNAKMRRTGICGATETILVDRSIASSVLPPIIQMLIKAGCEVRGDQDVQNLDSNVIPAVEEDWYTEYLDAIVSIKLVDGVEAAINHIRIFGSGHTEAIITESKNAAEFFLNSVDSAIVMLNASTQFADGAEFGMGAEIGISTGKLHARGPVGVEQLTSFKYVVRGSGQCR